jgi:hypothetical protein
VGEMKNACCSLIEKLEENDNLGDQDDNVRFKVNLKGLRCNDEVYLNLHLWLQTGRLRKPMNIIEKERLYSNLKQRTRRVNTRGSDG